MILKDRAPKKDLVMKSGFSLFEVMVVCLVGVLLSALAFRQIQSERKNAKVTEVKTNLTFLHQGAQQLAKKWEFIKLKEFLSTNPDLNNCYKNNMGTDCVTLGATPRDIFLHTGAGLSALQREENAYLNGGFRLDGSLCDAPLAQNCPFQNITQMTFDNCTSNNCTGVKFTITTRLNSAVLNSEDKGSLAAIPNAESIVTNDASEDRGLASTVSSCSTAGGAFGFNAVSGQSICDVTLLPASPLIFDETFGGDIQNGELQLVSGGSGPTPPIIPVVPLAECPPPQVLVELKADGTAVCKTPVLATCEGEVIYTNGQVVSANVGNEDLCLIRIPAGVTIYVQGAVTFQAQEIEIHGHIDGSGRGSLGGRGGNGGHGGACSHSGCNGATGQAGASNAVGFGLGGGGGAGGAVCGGGPCSGGAGGNGIRGLDGSNASAKGQVGGGGGGGGGAGGGGYGREAISCRSSGSRSSLVLEPGGGGGAGAGGRGGAAIQIITDKLTVSGQISVLGLRNAGNGGGGTNPPNAASVGSGGTGGTATVFANSAGQGGGTGNGCRGFRGGRGGSGGGGGKGGDGSIYIEFSEKIGNFSSLNKGDGYFQEVSN